MEREWSQREERGGFPQREFPSDKFLEKQKEGSSTSLVFREREEGERREEMPQREFPVALGREEERREEREEREEWREERREEIGREEVESGTIGSFGGKEFAPSASKGKKKMYSVCEYNCQIFNVQDEHDLVLPSSILQDINFPNLSVPPINEPTSSNPLPSVKILKWHPYLRKFAVCLQNDEVLLFDFGGEGGGKEWTPLSLSHPHHNKVECLEWKPKSGNTIALGCDKAVCVWVLVKDPSLSLDPPAAKRQKKERNDFFPKKDNALFHRGGLFGEEKEEGGGEERELERGGKRGRGGVGEGWVRVLERAGVEKFSSVSWSPNGLQLVGGSSDCRSFVVWDYPTGGVIAQLSNLSWGGAARWVGGGGGAKGVGGVVEFAVNCGSLVGETLGVWPRNYGVNCLKFSPNGHYLFVGNTDYSFSLYETMTWTREFWKFPNDSKKYNSGNGKVIATWSPDSQHLLVAVEDSPVFHHLLVENAPPGIRTHLLKIQIGTPKFGPDGDFLSTVLGKEGEGEEGEGELGVGGVKELLWDPAGERVVVVGEGRGEGGEKKSLVFLFCVDRDLKSMEITSKTTSLFFRPVGYLRGPDSGPKATASFKPCYSKGSLLTVSWASGKISFYPLFYRPRFTDS